MSGKYMFIFYDANADKLSPEESQQHMQKWINWIEKLQKQGRYLAGDPLLKDRKILSTKNGKIIVDGPYAESKEVVGGYFLITANSFDEAVEISKDYPGFAIDGKVEVREIMNMEMPAN